MLERVRYRTDPDWYEYRLTEAGLDLFPAILTLKAWAERHLLDPKDPRLHIRHRACGAELAPLVVCGAAASLYTPARSNTEPQTASVPEIIESRSFRRCLRTKPSDTSTRSQLAARSTVRMSVSPAPPGDVAVEEGHLERDRVEDRPVPATGDQRPPRHGAPAPDRAASDARRAHRTRSSQRSHLFPRRRASHDHRLTSWPPRQSFVVLQRAREPRGAAWAACPSEPRSSRTKCRAPGCGSSPTASSRRLPSIETARPAPVGRFPSSNSSPAGASHSYRGSAIPSG